MNESASEQTSSSGSNFQIEAYRKPRPLKQHERELLAIMQADYPELRGRVLDIGCAACAFIEAMTQVYPEADYTGFDISEELIAIAREKFDNKQIRVHLFVADAMEFQPDAPFDIIIASGVLSIFEHFEPVLDRWLSWLADKGTMYVFGRFNSADVDTIIRFRNNYTGGSWEGGPTAYSIRTVGRFLDKRGFDCEFKRFHLKIELPRNEDPIRTYTIRCKDDSLLVVNGANIIAEHYFLSVRKR